MLVSTLDLQSWRYRRVSETCVPLLQRMLVFLRKENYVQVFSIVCDLTHVYHTAFFCEFSWNWSHTPVFSIESGILLLCPTKGNPSSQGIEHRLTEVTFLNQTAINFEILLVLANLS